MNIEQANEIYARELGLNSGISSFSVDTLGNKRLPYTFTIEDARCRELVREKYRVSTSLYYSEKGWSCAAEGVRPVFGKSIAEAEISCLLQIAERLEG